MANENKQPLIRGNNFYCDEKILQGVSSELFSDESIPGVWHVKNNDPENRTNSFRTDLEPDDVKLVNELGRLSPDQLMEYIRRLQSNAFSLGIEEAQQFTKAKVLQIFKPKDI